MRSNVDIQKVVRALGESKVINLDLTLGELLDSPATSLINSVAHLEEWDNICYTWITFIRRTPREDLGFPVVQPGREAPVATPVAPRG